MEKTITLQLTEDQTRIIGQLIKLAIETGNEIIANRPKRVAEMQEEIVKIKKHLSPGMSKLILDMSSLAMQRAQQYIDGSEKAIAEARQETLSLTELETKLKLAVNETWGREENNNGQAVRQNG